MFYSALQVLIQESFKLLPRIPIPCHILDPPSLLQPRGSHLQLCPLLHSGTAPSLKLHMRGPCVFPSLPAHVGVASPPVTSSPDHSRVSWVTTATEYIQALLISQTSGIGSKVTKLFSDAAHQNTSLHVCSPPGCLETLEFENDNNSKQLKEIDLFIIK